MHTLLAVAMNRGIVLETNSIFCLPGVIGVPLSKPHTHHRLL